MTTYSIHYNAKAPESHTVMYDPMYAQMDPRHSRLRPLCKIRGRKDVTSDANRVTCGTCQAKLADLDRTVR